MYVSLVCSISHLGYLHLALFIDNSINSNNIRTFMRRLVKLRSTRSEFRIHVTNYTRQSSTLPKYKFCWLHLQRSSCCLVVALTFWTVFVYFLQNLFLCSVYLFGLLHALIVSLFGGYPNQTQGAQQVQPAKQPNTWGVQQTKNGAAHRDPNTKEVKTKLEEPNGNKNSKTMSVKPN